MTVRPYLFFVLALGLMAGSPSAAAILYGNPTSKIVLDSGGPVDIGSVYAFACPGSDSDDVDDTLTTSTALYATLPEDTWCDLYIQVKWNGSESYDNVQVTGFTSFVTDSGESQRTIRLYPASETAVLE